MSILLNFLIFIQLIFCFHSRTNQLLENICEGVEPSYFYTCIWLCVANNSPVRLPAISYVLAHYSRKLTMEDQLYLMGKDIGLMVRINEF